MNNHRLTTVAGLVLLVLAGSALADNHQHGPGHVDLEWIEIPADATEIQDIDLGPILDSLAADAEERGDDALVQAIAMVEGIRVKSFSVDEGGDEGAAAAVAKIKAHLEKEDWKRLVYLKDGDETIGVYTFYEGRELVGLMVLMYEPGDSVAFVNVTGDLDIGTMMRLAHQIDSDHLEDIMEEYGDGHGVHVHVEDD